MKNPTSLLVCARPTRTVSGSAAGASGECMAMHASSIAAPTAILDIARRGGNASRSSVAMLSSRSCKRRDALSARLRLVGPELLERRLDEARVDGLLDRDVALDLALLLEKGEIVPEAFDVDVPVGIATLRGDRAIEGRVLDRRVLDQCRNDLVGVRTGDMAARQSVIVV